MILYDSGFKVWVLTNQEWGDIRLSCVLVGMSLNNFLPHQSARLSSGHRAGFIFYVANNSSSLTLFGVATTKPRSSSPPNNTTGSRPTAPLSPFNNSFDPPPPPPFLPPISHLPSPISPLTKNLSSLPRLQVHSFSFFAFLFIILSFIKGINYTIYFGEFSSASPFLAQRHTHTHTHTQSSRVRDHLPPSTTNATATQQPLQRCLELGPVVARAEALEDLGPITTTTTTIIRLEILVEACLALERGLANRLVQVRFAILPSILFCLYFLFCRVDFFLFLFSFFLSFLLSLRYGHLRDVYPGECFQP